MTWLHKTVNPYIKSCLAATVPYGSRFPVYHVLHILRYIKDARHPEQMYSFLMARMCSGSHRYSIGLGALIDHQTAMDWSIEFLQRTWLRNTAVHNVLKVVYSLSDSLKLLDIRRILYEIPVVVVSNAGIALQSRSPRSASGCWAWSTRI